MFILFMVAYFLSLTEKELNTPNFRTEFTLDLDKDGVIDYISLSSGKIALSSNKFRVRKIQKFNPQYAIVKESEIWLLKIAKALTYLNGAIILRKLSLKEQIWLRMYHLEPWRADILTFNLLLTLLTFLISIEKIYRFINSIVSRDLNIKEANGFLEHVFWFLVFFLLIFLVIISRKFLWGAWIWVAPLTRNSFRHFFLSKKFFIKITCLFLLLLLISFLYISYFGLWVPVI